MRGTKALVTLGAAALLAACQTTNPEKASVVRNPQQPAVSNTTPFANSLQCMDRLFQEAGITGVLITSSGIPDATGRVRAGTKDMLISAISKMSARSNAFIFVDYDADSYDVNNLQGIASELGYTEGFDVPQFYLRGAVSQLDEGVISDSLAAGLSIEDIGALGYGQDQVVSVLSLDMNLGNLYTRQIVPGLFANNSMAVKRTGQGGDAEGSVGKFGVFFELNFNRSEGMHQAVRTLIELSTIEVLGKLSEVPYWQCLNLRSTNPEVMKEVRGWYDDMSPSERIEYIQAGLSRKGGYSGPVNGQQNPQLSQAIAAFQAQKNLIQDGKVNFDVYLAMVEDRLTADPQIALATARERPQPAAVRPLNLSMSPSGRSQPVYSVNETMSVSLTPSTDAYVYCYYQDSKGQVSRIFPNRFAPNAFINGGSNRELPSRRDGFEIVADAPSSRDEFMCIAAKDQVGSRIPATLMQEDLTPLPVSSLEQVAQAFKNASEDQVAIDSVRVTVQ